MTTASRRLATKFNAIRRAIDLRALLGSRRKLQFTTPRRDCARVALPWNRVGSVFGYHDHGVVVPIHNLDDDANAACALPRKSFGGGNPFFLAFSVALS